VVGGLLDENFERRFNGKGSYLGDENVQERSDTKKEASLKERKE
jgi:hypothetical protein